MDYWPNHLFDPVLLKDATSDKKISITINSQSNDFSADSSVISSPLCNVITHLEKSSSDNLIYDSAANDDELEQAATKVQAAFRGYLVCFWNLIKCILKDHFRKMYFTPFTNIVNDHFSPIILRFLTNNRTM